MSFGMIADTWGEHATRDWAYNPTGPRIARLDASVSRIQATMERQVSNRLSLSYSMFEHWFLPKFYLSIEHSIEYIDGIFD